MIDILNASMVLFEPTMVVSNLIYWVAITIITGIGYIVWKWDKNKKAKKILIGRLLSEIYRNQKVLEPLFTAAKKLENKGSNFSEDINCPNELNFNKSIYSESSDKFGLLDDESLEIIDKYYPELDYIENKYTKFKNIHGASYSDLRYLMVQYQMNEIYNQPKNKDNVQRWLETEEFLRYTKKVYDLGDELIKSMKDK